MKNTFKDIYTAVNPANPIGDWSSTERAKILRYANGELADVDELLSVMKLDSGMWTTEEKAKIKQALVLPN